MDEKNCVFCKIARKEIPANILWEDDSYLAFLDQNPVQKGHTLLIPKKHSDYIFDLEDGEYAELFLKAKNLAHRLKEKLHPKRVGIVVEGFGVAHVHVHLIPINAMNEMSPTNRPVAGKGELAEIAELIIK
jgi:histidine triad (HIT) family protein